MTPVIFTSKETWLQNISFDKFLILKSQKLVITLCNSEITKLKLTLVIPMAPTFSEYDVVPFPVPKMAAITQQMPSTNIPRLTACRAGGLAPANLAQA